MKNRLTGLAGMLVYAFSTNAIGQIHIPSIRPPVPGANSGAPCYRVSKAKTGEIDLLSTTGAKTPRTEQEVLRPGQETGPCLFPPLKNKTSFAEFAPFIFANFAPLMIDKENIGYSIEVIYSHSKCEKPPASPWLPKKPSFGEQKESEGLWYLEAAGDAKPEGYGSHKLEAGSKRRISWHEIVGPADVSLSTSFFGTISRYEECYAVIHSINQFPSDSSILALKFKANGLVDRINDNYQLWLLAGPLAKVAKYTIQELVTIQNGGISQSDGEVVPGTLDRIVDSIYVLALQLKLDSYPEFTGQIDPAKIKAVISKPVSIHVPTVRGTTTIGYTDLHSELPQWIYDILNYTILDGKYAQGLTSEEIASIESGIGALQQKVSEYSALSSVVTGQYTPEASPAVATIESILERSVADAEAFLAKVSVWREKMLAQYNELQAAIQKTQ